MLAEEFDDFSMAFLLREEQRRFAIPVFGVHICPVTDKQFDHCFMVYLGRIVQRRSSTLGILNVGIRPFVKKQPVATVCRVMQIRPAKSFFCIDVGAVGQK